MKFKINNSSPYFETKQAGRDGFVDSDKKMNKIFNAIEKAEKFGGNSNPKLTEIADSYDDWSCTKTEPKEGDCKP